MNEENLNQHNDYVCTPPPNRKIRNPFDKALIGRLHKPICSPGMCKIYKQQCNGSFRWEIDQACTLVPTDIVACNSQFEPTPDPILERIAEEQTEKFFSQDMVIPSPLESSKKIRPLQLPQSSSVNIDDEVIKEDVLTRNVSSQTVLTLPPVLPPELETMLHNFCTFTHDQDISGEYDITANGSLRRKLFFEEHSDIENYDSEQTDDESHIEKRSPSNIEHHTPIKFSPDLSHDLMLKGMKRTFGTPLKKVSVQPCKSGYRNKILDSVDIGEPCFSPILFRTPQRKHQELGASCSIASESISPVTKATSSDEEKNNFSSPELEAMATCLNCISPSGDEIKQGVCFCKTTPNKSLLRRSASLKESPRQKKKSSFQVKRSVSMSNLHRNKSVQKLDFSFEMSVDESLHEKSRDLSLSCHSVLGRSESTTSLNKDQSLWAMEDETSVQINGSEISKEKHKDLFVFSGNHLVSENTMLYDETPLKAKTKSNVRTHDIGKIRAPIVSPINMSLDNSIDSNTDNLLNMEYKKIDFNNVNIKFLTDNASNIDCSNITRAGESTVRESYRRVDSGFNENTFNTNASSYYESSIKPSELTVTDVSRSNNTKGALQEISNTNWIRIDSGFKDDNSTDSDQFYLNTKKLTNCKFSEMKLEGKENLMNEEFDKVFVRSSNKNDVMSISDIIGDDNNMTFNCNYSSTPSKNKSRNVPL